MKLPFDGCGQVPAGELTVQEMTLESFEGVDIALFSCGAGVSKQMREAVVRAGAVMIDNSSAFRMDEDVPLVVPEVNPGGHRVALRRDREPELLHHPDGGGLEASLRPGAHHARGGVHLPGRQRAGRAGHGRALRPDARSTWAAPPMTS